MSRPPRKDRPRRGKLDRLDSDRKEPADKPARGSFLSPESIRETIESLAVALIAAFLLRTFVVEAFVIPTGSMAPTLMGRHRDVTCAKCGYPYQVNASSEMDEFDQPTGRQVISGTCPMCRFTMDLTDANTLGKTYPSYSGDRILAGRLSYAAGNPKRWDVVVFQYPLNASVNYIKRLVGLPNETLRIQYGDVWIKPDGATEFALERKPPAKVLATMQPVYDNDYLLPELLEKGWPTRWTSLDSKGGWQAAGDQKSFHCDGSGTGDAWLGYRHVVPRFEDWASWTGVSSTRPISPKPQLISDFTAYDTDLFWPDERFGVPPGSPPPPALRGGLGRPPYSAALGLNWVGDLIVEFELDATSASGQVLVDLIKGGHPFLCRLDLQKGTSELTIPGKNASQPKSSEGIRGPGRHRVRLANVDQQLFLWLDGRLVKFDTPTTYDSSDVDTTVPNREDLLPVRIGSHGAAVDVRRLRIYRDIYYIAVKLDEEDEPLRLMADFDPSQPDFPYGNLSPDRVIEFFSDPAQWPKFAHRRKVEFKLDKDQFFMLGDNSAESKDSRLWGKSQYFVERDLLIGKGLVVYWPHSWHRIPGTRIPFPYFPNFSRMGRIQ